MRDSRCAIRRRHVVPSFGQNSRLSLCLAAPGLTGVGFTQSPGSNYHVFLPFHKADGPNPRVAAQGAGRRREIAESAAILEAFQERRMNRWEVSLSTFGVNLWAPIVRGQRNGSAWTTLFVTARARADSTSAEMAERCESSSPGRWPSNEDNRLRNRKR